MSEQLSPLDSAVDRPGATDASAPVLSGAYDDVVGFQTRLHAQMSVARNAEVEPLVLPFRSGDTVFVLPGNVLFKLHHHEGAILSVRGLPNWIRGVVAVAGEVYTVIDLGVVLGGKPAVAQNCTLLLLESSIERGCAIVADEIFSTTRQSRITQTSSTRADHDWLRDVDIDGGDVAAASMVDVRLLCRQSWFGLESTN